MKTELILKSDVLDIIFENRNKAYGAYYLRKFYSSRLTKSLGLMMAGVMVLSAFTFMPTLKKHADNDSVETIMGQILPQAKPQEKEPEKPKEKPQLPKKAPTVGFTVPNIVKNDVPVKPVENITDSTKIADVTAAGDPGTQFVVGGPTDAGQGDGKGKEPLTEPAVDINTPTVAPEVMPEFPGGMAGLRRFLQNNLTNPRDLEEGEMISVKVRFVVGYDGRLKSFETVEDGGEEFNREVIRVLKKMPEWIPGKTRGQNVSVYYTIPVKFVAGS